METYYLLQVEKPFATLGLVLVVVQSLHQTFLAMGVSMICTCAVIQPKFLAFVLTNVMLLSPAKLDSVSPYAI